ncbi:hypothetical protein NC99_41140 [Sunxiuqinia dokdonensis]|uniref:Uncharacterized protein n=1 Tax=Sunxiuqinia dokdonensis TaxID=1409788 RepID=A0A0L8V3L0_9BACT|nr:hypothetical protein NC99_41140 [Sunxiuqinia dokdonensis]
MILVVFLISKNQPVKTIFLKSFPGLSSQWNIFSENKSIQNTSFYLF